jgi:UDP-N-acetylmuramate dehydrogenase
LPSTDGLEGVREAVPLAPYTTLGIGGPARWFLEATGIDDIDRAHHWTRAHGAPAMVFGGGSNLVVSDDGFDGIAIHIAICGRTWITQGDDTLVTVGAGEPWDEIVADCVSRDLAGVECLSGIPGTVGGTPIQNVGAYGQEVASVCEGLTAYDRQTGTIRTMRAAECAFAYRTSRFKGADAGRFVICDVTLRLRSGAATVTYPDIARELSRAGVASPDVRSVRKTVLDVRRRKGMVIDAADPDTRSVGSFFMNPIVERRDRDRVEDVAGVQPPAYQADGGRVKLSAAWLIERAGFRRGDGDGSIGISTKHTLALVNRGGATARDVLRFAARIKRGVLDRFGINLRPEPIFVGFQDNHDLDFLQS